MTDIFYYLSKSFLYLALFPVFAIVLLIILYVLTKKSIKKNNISIYGIFLNFNKKNILSLALILLEYILIIETMFIINFSYTNIVLLFTPILIYAIINMDIINMIINILGTIFLLVMCFFERVFLSYILYVDVVWYVIALLIGVCTLIIIINTLIMMRNVNVLVKKSAKNVKSK